MSEHASPLDCLTTAQLRALAAVCEAGGVKEGAARLGMTRSGISSQLTRNIYPKLGVPSAAGACRIYGRETAKGSAGE